MGAPIRVSSSAGLLADACGLLLLLLLLVVGGTIAGTITGRAWTSFLLALVVALVGRLVAGQRDARGARRQHRCDDRGLGDPSASHPNPRTCSS